MKTKDILLTSYFLFVLGCAMSSCQKEISGNAAAPFTCGAGSVCAVVDGAFYVSDKYNAQTGSGTWTDLYFGASGFKYEFLISGQNFARINDSSITRYISFTIFTNAFLKQGNVFFSDTTYPDKLVYMKYIEAVDLMNIPKTYSNIYVSLDTDKLHRGQLTIDKIDTINNLISGTFNFTAYHTFSSGKTDSRTIKNGTFSDVVLRK